MNTLPCPQTHLPAAICSPLPWFLILPDQICHVASKGDRLQLMPSPLYGQLADLLLHRAVGCLLTEDWAQTSGYAFLSELSTSKPQEDTACSTLCDASPDLCTRQSSMFKALNRITNFRDKNTNKQQFQASPCLGLALQAYEFPPVDTMTAFQKP